VKKDVGNVLGPGHRRSEWTEASLTRVGRPVRMRPAFDPDQFGSHNDQKRRDGSVQRDFAEVPRQKTLNSPGLALNQFLVST